MHCPVVATFGTTMNWIYSLWERWSYSIFYADVSCDVSNDWENWIRFMSVQDFLVFSYF